MNDLFEYQDTVTFVKTSPSGYGNTKTVSQQVDVAAVFIPNTSFVRSGFQENIDADALCFPIPSSAFIIENKYRLEGFYVRAPLFDGNEDESWYKIDSCIVNRDHLLSNEIDNVELRLKKTRPIAGVS